MHASSSLFALVAPLGSNGVVGFAAPEGLGNGKNLVVRLAFSLRETLCVGVACLKDLRLRSASSQRARFPVTFQVV